jgi:acyl dehydratase
MRAGALTSDGAAPETWDGPWFEDLNAGRVFADAPGLTLTEGHAAVHQAIVGDRMKLPLDAPLSRAVVGGRRALAHPALVWDVAIGQSTTATRRVIANLFYRGLVLRRAVLIGDTLRTRTEVVALRQTSRRPDAGARGLALLHVTTTDQHDQVVLDFWRCAMLPLRDPDGATGADDAVDEVAADVDPQVLTDAVRDWRLGALRAAAPGPAFAELETGTRWPSDGGAVVSGAPELAHLSLNVALAHHDRLRPGGEGRRLVYGGHTVALAAAHAARVLPTLATIVAWHGCDHLAPVVEGDTLYADLEIERLDRLAQGGGIVHLRARVQAAGSPTEPAEPAEPGAPAQSGARRAVLDWRYAAVVA